MRDFGKAYGPTEFLTERRKFEASVSSKPIPDLPADGKKRRKAPTELKVATWNLRSSSNVGRTLAYLDSADWDVVCLQEVGIVASNRLAEREEWSVINGLQLGYDGVRGMRYPHGAVLVARNGWKLEAGAAVPGIPKSGRGAVALARRGDRAVRVMSWHAPNRAREGLETKMAGYQAIANAVRQSEGPLMVGLDANHNHGDISLDPCDPDPAHEHAHEIEFFSNNPGHRLSDALLVYLRKNPRAYNKIRRERPDGPLELTYMRKNRPTRFDYIMISNEFDVLEMVHDYKGAKKCGSDHAFVGASLAAKKIRAR